ncbi:MAG: hypothetical protein R3F31_16090 [Verrucomicrobiales bacterium]
MFRQNRVPGLALNGVVILLVLSYFRVPAVAGMWEALGAFKLRWSFAFSWSPPSSRRRCSHYSCNG